MPRWNTAEVKEYLESLGCVINHVSPGEDHTTDYIHFLPGDTPEHTGGTSNNLHVRGFSTGFLGEHPRDDCDVPMVELTSGYSDGGCCSKHENTCLVYGKLLAWFRQKGFQVPSRSMKDFF